MSNIAMSGNYENGSIIAVFIDRSHAEDWLDQMSNLLESEGLVITESEIEEVNTKFRAGIVFKKEQLEFNFG